MASITRISASIDAGLRQEGEPELSLCAAVSYLVDDSMKKARQSMTPAGLMHKGALRAFPRSAMLRGKFALLSQEERQGGGERAGCIDGKGPFPG